MAIRAGTALGGGGKVAGKILWMPNITCDGEVGVLCGDEERIGWRRDSVVLGPDSTPEKVLTPVALVRRAEWYEGQVRLLCEQERGSGVEVVTVQGFRATDFDPLWRYLEQYSSLYLKRIVPRSSCTATDFDEALRLFEFAADHVNELKSGSVQKKARETELMQTVEALRAALERAINGDRQQLCEVFGADDHQRIMTLRHILDMVRLDVFGQDPRWVCLRNLCATIEGILADMGSFRFWPPWEEPALTPRAPYRRCVGSRASSEDSPSDEAARAGQTDGTPDAADGADAGSVAGEAVAEVTCVRDEYDAEGAGPVAAEDGGLEVFETTETLRRSLSAPAATSSGGGDGMLGVSAGPSASRRASAEVVDFGNGRSTPQGLCKGPLSPTALFVGRCSPTDIGLEGWVWKSSRYFGLWRRRYLVLRGGLLIFFKDRSCQEATETVVASFVFDIEGETGSLSTGIALKTSSRTYHFFCDTLPEKEEWMRKLFEVTGVVKADLRPLARRTRRWACGPIGRPLALTAAM